jgi:hypothetical protein
MELRSIEKALKSYPRPARIQLTKLLFHLNQTNYWNNRFYGTTAACPCCNKAMEMFSHITTCPTKLATSSRLVSLLALQSDLDEIFTPKALSKLVLDKLSGKPVESSSNMESLLSAQHKIGWEHFLTGHISTQWQSHYSILHTPSKHPKPALWAAKFVSRIWKYSLS